MQIKFLSVGCGDAIAIRFLGQDNQYYNILIDGGVEQDKIYVNTVKLEIQAIVDRKENIDLWIISHIDDDHIGGVLRFIQDETLRNKINLSKTKFWYNHSNQDYNVNLKTSKLKSVNQGVRLYDFLKSQSIINEKITTSLAPIIFHGLKLTILSPNQKGYDKLMKEFQAEKVISPQTSKLVASKQNDYTTKLEDFDLKNFVEDTAVPNGSSIALLLEYKATKILLLADSHPSVLCETLKVLGYSAMNKLKVDLMQVPHHGSKANTSSKLLQLIDCQDFIISADAYNKHNLPNKETLARYIANFKKTKIKFHFTHKNDLLKSIFEVDKPLQNIECKFPIAENALIFNFNPNE